MDFVNKLVIPYLKVHFWPISFINILHSIAKSKNIISFRNVRIEWKSTQF